jgi:hypothetical protein
MTSLRYSPLVSEPAAHGPWESGAQTAMTTVERQAEGEALIEHATPRCTATAHAVHADHPASSCFRPSAKPCSCYICMGHSPPESLSLKSFYSKGV